MTTPKHHGRKHGNGGTGNSLDETEQIGRMIGEFILRDASKSPKAAAILNRLGVLSMAADLAGKKHVKPGGGQCHVMAVMINPAENRIRLLVPMAVVSKKGAKDDPKSLIINMGDTDPKFRHGPQHGAQQKKPLRQMRR